MSIKLGSLFDGSGGFPLAGAISGIEPVWAAEVEPYPIAVTRSRFPQMEHLGSVTEVHGDKVRPVDVITFGSPCQDLSVAGKRAGIRDGQRSNLFFEAIRIIKEMRDATNGQHPTFAVWENVPGAFSSNKGEDFRCVLEAFVRISAEISVPRPANGRWNPAGEIVGDGFSVAWRQLDAQYWGVPQRRKRIYLVADFADERAGEILFERESLRGHPAACGAPGQGTAADTAGSTGRSREIECLNPWDAQSIRQYAVDGVFQTLTASISGGQNRQGIVYGVEGNTVDRSSSKNGKGYCEDVSPTMNTQDRHAVVYETAVSPTLTGYHENRVTDYTAITVYRSPKIGEYAADGTEHHPVYAVDCRQAALDGEKTHTLQAKTNCGQSLNCTPSVLMAGRPQRRYIIRRLTPLECCRLQGFPDGWGIPDHKDKLSNEELEFWQGVRDTCASIAGKPPKKYSAKALTKWYNALHTDSAEYKMWGNGIALPCAAFVLGNVANIIRENVE